MIYMIIICHGLINDLLLELNIEIQYLISKLHLRSPPNQIKHIYGYKAEY